MILVYSYEVVQFMLRAMNSLVDTILLVRNDFQESELETKYYTHLITIKVMIAVTIAVYESIVC